MKLITSLVAVACACALASPAASQEAAAAAHFKVPKGAVVAFNLTQCPKGWNPFVDLNGRVIVGAGTGQGLTPRTYGDFGGHETLQISIDQMPSHRHGYSTTDNGPPHDNRKNFIGGAGRFGQIGPRVTTDAGGRRPIVVMQPFYTLTYCEKA